MSVAKQLIFQVTMAPPNTDTQVLDNLAEQVEKIDLKQLGREKGRYLVYPEKTVNFSVQTN